MSELESLQAEARKIAERIDEIETAAKAEERRKLVGKTFRCRNNYSCPSKPSDYWWLWLKVTSCDEDGVMTAFSFQEDCHGEFTIKMAGTHFGTILFRDRVPAALFNAAWRTMRKKIAAANP